jgi:putative tryptophan/tyrosine transport system substrate-binding protein
VEAVTSGVHDAAEIETVIAAFAREPSSGLIVLPSSFTVVHQDLITALPTRYRLPAVYAFRFYPANGGLMSYGNVPADSFRQASVYVDRILRGAKPADLPVQAPVRRTLTRSLRGPPCIGRSGMAAFVIVGQSAAISQQAPMPGGFDAQDTCLLWGYGRRAARYIGVAGGR